MFTLVMDEEEWRTIQSFPDYMVSNHGRVKSLKKGRELILSQCNHYKGYKVVYLYKDKSIDFKCFVHRLVAETFIVNIDTKPFVNHIDCNKTNNVLTNLEWMTEQENSQWYHKNKNPVDDNGIPF